jgi:hypothetical protein
MFCNGDLDPDPKRAAVAIAGDLTPPKFVKSENAIALLERPANFLGDLDDAGRFF